MLPVVSATATVVYFAAVAVVSPAVPLAVSVVSDHEPEVAVEGRM